MLDPVIEFFTMIFHKIGQGIGWVIAVMLWPFVALGRWYKKRSWLVRGPVGLLLLALVVGYGFLLYQTQSWRGFNANYMTEYAFVSRGASAGKELQGNSESGVKTCAPSAIVKVTRDLIDFNVNQNQWVPAMLLSKLGLFGMDWKYTPFLDNKAAFQRGVNQTVRRTTAELIDRLGRVRGTSQLDQNLQKAREAMFYQEDLWYFSGIRPVQPTPSRYRSAIPALDEFNASLAKCDTTFDPRADNLKAFLDRVTADIGSTSDILRERAESHDSGWFDTRADDRFWFTYGQLYGYAGIMKAARADFDDVVTTRQLNNLWDRMDKQFEQALAVQPFIISNGAEAGWIMPTHLATAGFYVLRVRSNLVEMRDVLDR